MPLNNPSARSLAKEFGAKIEAALAATGDVPRPPEAQPGWPAWSSDLFTIWLGIPKTAGTTLSEIISPKFGDRVVHTMSRSAETDSALGIQRVATIKEIWDSIPAERRESYKL